MQRFLHILLTLMLGLWLGGLAALVVFAIAFFAHDRAVASLAVPVLFQTFATYHLIAAGVALLLIVALRWRAPRRLLTIQLILIVIAAACAVGSTLALGKMEQVRRDDPRENMMDQPAFRRMHILSNIIYSFEMLSVLAALILLAATDRTSRTTPADEAAASDTPATTGRSG
jgi:hypothetical protein